MPQRSLVDAFPQEIIDRMLDNLSINPIGLKYEPIIKGYTANLRACSLVCRTFTPRCQYHLFSALRLRQTDEECRIERERYRRDQIYKILLSKPHNLNGVRHVSVDIGARGMKSVVHEELGDLDQPGLLPLLRELPISSIEIIDRTRNYTDLEDGDLYPNPLTIEYYFIQPFIQTTFITLLSISNVVINASILAYFPNISDLDLWETLFEVSMDYKKIAAPQPRPQLQTLRVFPTCIIEELLCVCGSDALPLLDLSHLRKLETPLSGDDEDILIVGRVLNMCAQHLKELDLHDATVIDPFPGCFRSSDITELQSLIADNRGALWNIDGHFSKLTMLYLWSGLMTVENNASVSDNPLIDYCHFLAKVPSQNNLGCLDINICILCLETISPVCWLEASGWDGLEYEIMRISNGKVLKLNLNIMWKVTRYRSSMVELAGDKKDWENAIETLRTILIPAIREKFQRVKQSLWIV